jgi:hypothetical protein
MRWIVGVALLGLGLVLWLGSSDRRSWDWVSNWAGKVVPAPKPKPAPVIVPPPAPPVTASPPKPVPAPIQPRPKAKPKAQPKVLPKPAQKPAAVTPGECRQISAGISIIGREAMRREARERGYSDAQVIAAERACGF